MKALHFIIRPFLFLFISIGFVLPIDAQGTTAVATQAPSTGSGFHLDLDTALFAIAFTLAIVIIALLGVLRSSIRFYIDKNNNTLKAILWIVMIFYSSQEAFAQQANAVAGNPQNFTFLLSVQGWLMLIIIAVEIYALILIRKWIRFYTGIEKFETRTVEIKPSWWDRINAFKSIDSESDLDTGHNYDGIRELDNITPPWFTAAFLGTILFAAIYLYRYHIAESAPLQLKEYQNAMKIAEQEQALYLREKGDQIDENNVELLPAGQYEEGKTIFKATCAVCHGDKGQGLVGPNLTDEYWIHGGSVKEIFTVIKYGVMDKGMRNWKDEYGPNQIAQLSSYIKSLKGTNPPGAKAAQGTLYTEATPGNTDAKQDTLKTTK